MGYRGTTRGWHRTVSNFPRSSPGRLVCGGPVRLMQFVELHARSAFSFLEGASVPEALSYACANKQLPAMALLDRNGLYGSPRFHLTATSNKIKSHVGAELSVGETEESKSCYYPLLVKNRAGYQNLCRLITKTKLRAGKNKPTAATLGELQEHAEGLICLTGDEAGPLAEALKSGNKDGARRLLNRLQSIFGRNNVYVELQRHFRPEQEHRNHAAIDLAREFDLPLLASNGVRYATPDDRHLLDALTCVKHKCTLDEAGDRLQINSQRHVRSGAEMLKLFSDLPEAVANTSELSSRLEFTLENLGYEFPRYPVPGGETEISYLRVQVAKGSLERYQPVTDRARRQLERELKLIEKLKLAGYFLIVWDLVKFCRENHILVQGRGSAANSAVCYSLGITAVDPIAMDLLFERFLSEERGEWPDIDLDLPSGDQRERAIQYVYQRYGQLGAAMTANVITYRGRSAVRDIGKVLGFEEPDLGRIAALVPSWGWTDPKDTAERQFREAGFSPDNPLISKFLDLYMTIQDLPRHLGQHSGGMVICEGQLDSVVPLEPATMPGRVVIQWDKEDCADMGIVKV